jgi:hypothetical protein
MQMGHPDYNPKLYEFMAQNPTLDLPTAKLALQYRDAHASNPSHSAASAEPYTNMSQILIKREREP